MWDTEQHFRRRNYDTHIMELETPFHFQGDNPAALGEAAPLLPARLPLSSAGEERLSVSTAVIPTLLSHTCDF